MVCYICGKPASFRCPVCGRYVCNEHTHSTAGIQHFSEWLRNKGVHAGNLPLYLCDSCFKEATEYGNAETQAEYYHTHYCDFHKRYHDDEYLANDKWGSKLGIVYCETCKKQICADSAIEGYTKKIYYGSSSYSDEGSSKCSADEADQLYIVTTYLCPICEASLVMYKISYYKAVYEYGFFFTNKKWEYQYAFWESKYIYDKERHKFVLNLAYNTDCDYYEVGLRSTDTDHD
jgi:hypothetical protein